MIHRPLSDFTSAIIGVWVKEHMIPHFLSVTVVISSFFNFQSSDILADMHSD